MVTRQKCLALLAMVGMVALLCAIALSWVFRWREVEEEAQRCELSFVERICRAAVTAGLIGFGIEILAARELFLFSTLRNPHGVHLIGWAKDFMVFAMFSAAVSTFLPLALHYREQANPSSYGFVARLFAVLGWIFVGASITALWVMEFRR